MLQNICFSWIVRLISFDCIFILTPIAYKVTLSVVFQPSGQCFNISCFSPPSVLGYSHLSSYFCLKYTKYLFSVVNLCVCVFFVTLIPGLHVTVYVAVYRYVDKQQAKAIQKVDNKVKQPKGERSLGFGLGLVRFVFSLVYSLVVHSTCPVVLCGKRQEAIIKPTIDL